MPTLKRRGIEITLNNFYNLLGRGFLEQLQAVFDPESIGDEVKAALANTIEHSLYLQSDFSPEDHKWPPGYVEGVRRWREFSVPPGLRGTMLTALSVVEWHFDGERREEWLSQIRGLARVLFDSPETLIAQFDWLFSEAAKSADFLGEELGRLDRNGSLLDRIVDAAVKYHNSTLGRGYITGFVSHEGADLERLNRLLDGVQQRDAQLAYELFITGGQATKATERVLRSVEDGNLSVRHFRPLALGWRGASLTQEEITAILNVLLGRVSKGETESAEIAIDIAADRCLERKSPSSPGGTRRGFVDLAWRVVEATALNPGRESVWWAKILESLIPYDMHRAADLAAASLLGEGLMQEEQAGAILQKIAAKEPGVAIEALGSAIMDAKRGWRFLVGKFDFIRGLPPKAVAEWIDRHGVEAAIRMARQLPPPYLDEGGGRQSRP